MKWSNDTQVSELCDYRGKVRMRGILEEERSQEGGRVEHVTSDFLERGRNAGHFPMQLSIRGMAKLLLQLEKANSTRYCPVNQ